MRKITSIFLAGFQENFFLSGLQTTISGNATTGGETDGLDGISKTGHAPFFAGHCEEMGENDELPPDCGRRNGFQSLVSIFGDIFSLNRSKETLPKPMCFEVLYTAGFLIDPFFVFGDFFQVAIQGFGQ
jgi:hypothetical protein